MLTQDPYVKKSIDWLLSIRNADGGWGMYEHHPTRIINTAEAVTALLLAGAGREHIQPGLDYLARSAQDESWCQYLRHHAWVVYTLATAGLKERIPPRCLEALYAAESAGAWPHLAGGPPTLFSTFLAARALHAYGDAEAARRAARWVSGRFSGNGWSHAEEEPSLSATSYAVLLLCQAGELSMEQGRMLERGKEFLLKGKNGAWPVEHIRNVSGDFQYSFHHNSLPWAVAALVAAGQSVFKGAMPALVREMYFDLFSPSTGGWTDEKDHRPTVYATSHAITAIHAIHQYTTIQELTSIVMDMESAGKATGRKIFVVHGHDELARLQMANFLNEINCEPVILVDHVDPGTTTIFQKFQALADQCSYAIALLTPDDTTVDSSGAQKKRSRQNVILELGYFLGRLGSDRVCIAAKGSLETPSDIGGVLYLDLEKQDWRYELSRRLYKLGFELSRF